MSLTGCIKKAGEHLNADDKKAILARAKELREQGIGRTESGRQAVQERIAFINNEKKTLREQQVAETQKSIEPPPPTEPELPALDGRGLRALKRKRSETMVVSASEPPHPWGSRLSTGVLGNGETVIGRVVTDMDAFLRTSPAMEYVNVILQDTKLRHILDETVDYVFIAEEDSPLFINNSDLNGLYTWHRTGEVGVVLRASLIDSFQGAFTLVHELGHAIDLPALEDQYSVLPGMKNIRDELVRLWDKGHFPELGYPFDNEWTTKMDSRTWWRETFAQAFTLMMMDPGNVIDHAPITAQFIGKVIKHAQKANFTFLRQVGRNRVAGNDYTYTSRQGSDEGVGQEDRGGQAKGRSPTPPVLASRGGAAQAQRYVASLPTASRSGAKRLWTTITDAAKKGFYGAAFTWDLADIARAKLPSVTKYMDLMSKKAAVKTQIEDQVEKIISQAEKLPSAERDTVNKFLYDSTLQGKWGYKDDPNSGIKVDAEMEQRFQALSPQAQTLVRSVFKHGAETLRTKQRIIKEEINNEFRQQIKEADNEPAKVEELEKKRRAALQHYDSILFLTANKPYTPLRRFGNYAVVARSQAFRDAVANNNTKGIERMQSDEDHYFVAFYETLGEAEAQADTLRATGRYAEASAFEKEKGLDAIHNGRDMMTAFQRLRNLIKSELEVDPQDKVGQALNSMLSDLYLQTLAETSARKAEIKRRNVAGADQDMLRAFASQGRADAHFIAALKHNGDVTDSIYEMRREAHGEGKDKADRMRLFNELMTRHALHMNYQEHRVQDAIMRGTSLWMLATSPAYYLQNATQTPMISVPYLAGKHGYGKSWGAITQAYEDLGPMMRGLKWSDRMDFSKAPADVRQALQDLVAAGRIDIALDQDLGRFHSAGQNGVSHLMYTVDRKLRGMAQRVEAINRVTAAIAAYRMEKAKNGGNHAAAVEYASKVVRVTHGDYSAFNSPKYLTPGGGLPAAKVVTQFRKFQIIQASLILRLFNNSFVGDVSAQERAIARKALFFTLGHTVAMGGFYGLPGASALAWVLGKLLSDPDEPDEDEFHLRRAIGNEDIADLVLKGAPAYFGLDLSGKLGMGAAFSLMPYAKLDTPSTQDAYKNALLALTGPFAGGLLPRMAEGVNQIGHGNYYKGMEFMLPNGFANTMKGYRYYTEGVTRKNGDVVMDPEEVEFATALFQSLGLQTKQLTDRSFDQKVMTEFETFYSDKASRIKEKYARAAKSSDSEAMAAAREQWMQLQDSRFRNGFTRQPLGDLLKAPVQQQRRERQVINHVGSRNNRRLPEELAEI